MQNVQKSVKSLKVEDFRNSETKTSKAKTSKTKTSKGKTLKAKTSGGGVNTPGSTRYVRIALVRVRGFNNIVSPFAAFVSAELHSLA